MDNELEDSKDYNKMKKEAGEFSKWLTEHEFTFKQEINDCYDGLGVYFEIEASNGTATITFADTGYVGITVDEKEEKEEEE